MSESSPLFCFIFHNVLQTCFKISGFKLWSFPHGFEDISMSPIFIHILSLSLSLSFLPCLSPLYLPSFPPLFCFQGQKVFPNFGKKCCAISRIQQVSVIPASTFLPSVAIIQITEAKNLWYGGDFWEGREIPTVYLQEFLQFTNFLSVNIIIMADFKVNT